MNQSESIVAAALRHYAETADATPQDKARALEFADEIEVGELRFAVVWR